MILKEKSWGAMILTCEGCARLVCPRECTPEDPRAFLSEDILKRAMRDMPPNERAIRGMV